MPALQTGTTPAPNRLTSALFWSAGGIVMVLALIIGAVPLAWVGLIPRVLLDDNGGTLSNRLNYAAAGMFIVLPYLIVPTILFLVGLVLIARSRVPPPDLSSDDQAPDEDRPISAPPDRTPLEYDY